MTNVLINGVQKNSIYLGIIKSGDVVKLTVSCPETFRAIINPHFGTEYKNDVYAVNVSGKDLFISGNNVLLRLVEKLGKGKLILHTIGFTRIGYRWQYVSTAHEIQFYSIAGKSALFTSSLLNQKELLKKLEEIAIGDKNIPNYALYKHKQFVPEPGTVKWFDPFRLIGAITTDDGDVLFHIKDCKTGHPKNQPWRKNFPRNGQRVLHLKASACTGRFSKKATLVIY